MKGLNVDTNGLSNILEVIPDNNLIKYDKDVDKWESQIMARRFPIFLGYFNTKEEAEEAYNKAMDHKISEWKRLNPGLEDIPNHIMLDGVQSDFYSKYHIILGKRYYNFPEWYSDEERNALCNQFIEARPQLFHYEIPTATNDRMPIRVQSMLSVTAGYLTFPYNKIKGQTTWETKYKREKRLEHEIPSCDIVDVDGNSILEF